MKFRFGRKNTDTIPESVKRAYKLGDIIAEGASGRVRLAYSSSRSEDVAIKIVKLATPEDSRTKFLWSRKRTRPKKKKEDTELDTSTREELLLELSIWKQVSKATPFAIEFFDFKELTDQFWFVMPLSTPLLYFISEFQEKHNKLLPMKVIKEIFAPIMLALVAMHRIGFVHRDVKPGNIVLSNGFMPKLIDFGLSKRFLNEDGSRIELVSSRIPFGTFYTTPPEAFVEGTVYNEAVDTFPLCLSMLTARMLKLSWYKRYHNIRLLYQLYVGSFTMLKESPKLDYEQRYLIESQMLPMNVQPEDLEFPWDSERFAFSEFAKSTMKLQVLKRPTVEEACKHAYVHDEVAAWEMNPSVSAQHLKQMIKDFESEPERIIYF
mmetsp:Transcript_5654/g.7422  ORF Transcript_5654/g.7422 Transcript_5654/m.7422 type:complete len:378 (+) Transcript_5654:322-1455(+)